jgi:hypothetical protein
MLMRARRFLRHAALASIATAAALLITVWVVGAVLIHPARAIIGAPGEDAEVTVAVMSDVSFTPFA